MTIASSPPRVSVIVTAYNSGGYIRRTLDSLLTQTLSNFEIVVVDDGSTDGTSEVLDGYARRDSRIRVVHQQNAGTSTASNRAITEARAEYLAILDHDDMAAPDRLEKQVAYLDSHSRVGVLGGAMIAIDHRDRKLNLYRFPTEPAQVRSWLFRAPTINHSSTMMRRQLVEKVGGYRKAFDIIPDVDLFLRISDHAELATLADVLVYYRVHPERVTARHHARQLVLNKVAIELARSRVRGKKDNMPNDIHIDASTLDRLGLDADQVERLRPLFQAGEATE